MTGELSPDFRPFLSEHQIHLFSMKLYVASIRVGELVPDPVPHTHTHPHFPLPPAPQCSRRKREVEIFEISLWSFFSHGEEAERLRSKGCSPDSCRSLNPFILSSATSHLGVYKYGRGHAPFHTDKFKCDEAVTLSILLWDLSWFFPSSSFIVSRILSLDGCPMTY